MLADVLYSDVLSRVMQYGRLNSDRTGTGRYRSFLAPTQCYPLCNHDGSPTVPLLSGKQVNTRAIVHELLWFLSGSQTIQYLRDNKVHIWDAWALPTGYVGRMYGTQWRDWGGSIDQIGNLIQNIRNDPLSARHVVSAWNPSDANDQALTPCHILFQCLVDENDELVMHLYQRSADMFLGVPFNIVSYALLSHVIASLTGKRATHLVHHIGDAHIYADHLGQVNEYLIRVEEEMDDDDFETDVTIELSPFASLDELTFDSFRFGAYHPLSPIPAPVSV